MSAVQQIQNAVLSLSPEERAALRAWFAELDAKDWDLQFEQDATSGRLDWLRQEALQDLRDGRCTDR